MVVRLYFVGITVLWGASAIITSHQAASAAPEVSVGLRMALVALVLFGWCKLTGKPIAIRLRESPWVLLQGVLFFSLSFITFYYATTYLPSGIAALILSTSSLVAAAIGWLFLKSPLHPRLILGLLAGVLGLACVVAPQFSELEMRESVHLGVLWATAAAVSTGFGTVIGGRNQRIDLPLPALLGWAALGGAVFAFCWALVSGASFRIDLTPAYIAGLAYLTLLASCVTFFLYFELVRKTGPAAAAYSLSGVPVFAIFLSVLFEGLAMDAPLIIGAVAIAAGNILVASQPAPVEVGALTDAEREAT